MTIYSFINMLITRNLHFLELKPYQLLSYCIQNRKSHLRSCGVDCGRILANQVAQDTFCFNVSQQNYSQMEACLQEGCQGQKNQQEASFKVDCTWLGIESLLPVLTFRHHLNLTIKHISLGIYWKPFATVDLSTSFEFDCKTYKSRLRKPSATVDILTSRAWNKLMHVQIKLSVQSIVW